MSPGGPSRQALELFDELADRPPAARDEALAELRGRAPELARAVEALLLADGRTSPLARQLEQPEPVDRAGEMRGPYRLLERIGEGGMGEVWRAERADDLYHRQVAVKLLRPLAASPGLMQRFASERRILARFDHPGIARILDGGSGPDGVPFLVMDLVEGEPIDSFCERRGLSLAARLALFAEVCRAVEHAHRNLVVHRDLKASNILVDSAGRPRLLDFGIAKVLSEERESADAARTLADLLLTPEAASPEQVRGEPVSTGTDVYSLGALLFRLLTGEGPHRFADLRPATIERVVCQEEPPRPSAVVAARPGGRRLAARLRGDLDAILAVALAKESAARYPSVERLRRDVEHWLAGRPVEARQPSLAYRAGRFVRRHRLGAGAAALVATAVLGGLVTTTWQAREAQRARARAESEAARARQVNELLLGLVASANPVVEGRSVTIAERLDAASAGLDRHPAPEPASHAVLRAALAESYWGLGLLAEASREARAAVAAARRLSPPDPARLGRALRVLGGIEVDAGSYAAAEETLRAALAALPSDPAHGGERALARDQLGVVYSRTAREEEARRELEAALAGLRAAGVAGLPLATTVNNLAVARGNAGDPAAAEALHREAIELFTHCCSEQHPRAAEALANLAGAVDAQGRHSEAETLYAEACRRLGVSFGPSHPQTLLHCLGHASNLRLLERYPQAAEVAAVARRAAEATLGADHPLTAYADIMYGEALVGLGRAEEALAAIDRGLAIRRRLLPPGHWLLATAEGSRGWALAAAGRREEGHRLLAGALAALAADRGPDHEQTRRVRERLARLAPAAPGAR